MIVIVTGGRDYAGTGLVEALDEVHAKHAGLHLYVGDARGADAIAREWAKRRGVYHLKFKANWAHGRGAGIARNAEMVSQALRDQVQFGHNVAVYLEPMLCIAAPGGRGTADCVRRCRKNGIEVREVTT